MLKENILVTNKKPSEELENMVNSYAQTTLDRAKLVEKIIIKAEREGLKPEQLRNMIKTALRKRGLSESTIYRAIPSELKDKKMQAVRSKRKPTITIKNVDLTKGGQIEFREHYIKNEGVNLGDIPPKSVMFLGNVNPLVNLPSSLYSNLKNRLLLAMRDKLPIKFELEGSEIKEIV